MKIIDLHNYQTGVPFAHTYCGRKMFRRYPEGSPLANPFKLPKKASAEDRRSCLHEYRQWLVAKVRKKDERVLAALNAIMPDSVLACWCCELEGDKVFSSPEVCHCQVIAKVASWVKQWEAAP